ncbi:MAG: polyhydroxyalkanoate biosynthesis repressor PhaR [Bdellovibrionales bacterium RIFOXYB1_FULL_37_110]|nr:MAG: polyhydroxyalkanoate biosynthesis repressor PhaR [Bdellovibrionales bacterium RIFOXYC1_FULL_37_79]OFZ58831.1 MAG: polyhydroxyalkanoate biosynthesis repressor PhaR [Bdellovibrionales bacterium RIFOXYB1_FULL_37_110]OFZ64830.1 MAG: polyhydroxyalkanoate biosynthesis repressor PhaR [Bdellovibrionales bacterium RIFOXYD1_FULL_36_51]
MMKPEIKIGKRIIGENYPPLVIAEIGINHEGSLETAYRMVDSAYEAGAEIIKHQTHVVDDEMSEEAKNVIPGNSDQSIYEIMARCALNEEDELKLKKYVESKGMIFLSTPFSRAAAIRLEKMGVTAYKIGSGECNNYPLIEHIARYGKPIILSTGMNTIESVSKAVEIFRKHKIQFALLHCTNVYPTPPEIIRLEAMKELQKSFPDAVVGLSDHSITNYPCIGAIALGASIVERHFTDTKQRLGPDIMCSMDTKELKELIEASKILQKARGGIKGAVIEEQPTINFAFASVVAIKDIKKGDVFTRDNLWVKRPGVGEFKAESFESLLGLCAANDIGADSLLRKLDIVGEVK